jgi:hypothetical protein
MDMDPMAAFAEATDGRSSTGSKHHARTQEEINMLHHAAEQGWGVTPSAQREALAHEARAMLAQREAAYRARMQVGICVAAYRARVQVGYVLLRIGHECRWDMWDMCWHTQPS